LVRRAYPAAVVLAALVARAAGAGHCDLNEQACAYGPARPSSPNATVQVYVTLLTLCVTIGG